MGDEPQVMHQRIEDEYVTPSMCEMHHKIMEGQLELLRQKDKALEEKIGGVEVRLTIMERKIDDILKWQVDQYKVQVGILIAIVLTLVGVFRGRAIDFGMFV
jgi:hypothetical protein